MLQCVQGRVTKVMKGVEHTEGAGAVQPGKKQAQGRNSLKLCQERFRLDIKENHLPARVHLLCSNTSPYFL